MNGDSTTNTMGTVKISTDAIAAIASLTAQKVNGVAGLHRGALSVLLETLGRKNEHAGVKAMIGDKEVWLELLINVKYGVEISEVAVKVQDKVREAVESMTGLTVREVNVSVRGIIQ